MHPAFVHLRLHSEFSLVDGIVKIKPLVKRLAELNMPAIAVTEHTNLFSLVKFYKAALGQGIKPIAGSDVLIFNPEDSATPHRLTLLVNNHTGYITLTELISKAYQEGQHQGVPMLRPEWIVANHKGLIALSGAMSGDIGKALLAENLEAAKRLAEFWGGLFPQSFYLEVQRLGKPDEERYIAAVVELALATGLSVVATNDVRFIHQQDFAAHEVRVCINQSRVLDDSRRPKDYTDQQYLRSVEEMQTLFFDLPEALENSVEIAKRCNLKLTLGENFLPDFPVPEGMNLGEFMAEESMKGLEQRLLQYPAVGNGTDEENRVVYYQRLDFELKMITQMGFPGYFMIVADFIQWAKNNLIPVGPGRGSGAGSLVAYALKITDLDPIEFDLLFERFLNPERVSMPDFDVDFCMDRRDEVIDYVARHYGRDHVAQIITYGSMAAKAVIRDVGRVLGFGYGFVDRLAKLIPFEIGMTLTKALKDSPELKQLYDAEEEVKTLIDMALSLEGTARNAGKHAGGVVISPTKLTDFTPLYCDQDGNNLVTQFDKDDVEAVGLVKFDFLGLRTLTIIDWALQDINAKQKQQGKPLVDITTIPRDDAATYRLLTNALTTAVFQLESRGMKELIKKLKPDCFDDIIALVALFRPGPLESGMVDDYINVKHGAKAEYAHPLLMPILKPTNGVILYQEQVMQIAREMALYTLGGADMLRRAMGKKKPEEMAKERHKFTAGAIENQVDEKIATYVFDLMEKFAGYGFNKTIAKSTKIRTVKDIKNIEDCQVGDVVFSMNADGSVVQSNVVALHDHGNVPLWLVEFDDGTQERCTVDHKWLTDDGQVPLWKILSMGMQVWGGSASQTRYINTPETMPNLYEPNPHGAKFRQRHCDVLWRTCKNPEKSTNTFSNLPRLLRQTPRNSCANMQRLSAYSGNATKIFSNSKEHLGTFGCARTAGYTIEKLARGKSRKIQCDSCKSSCVTEIIENGSVFRALSGRKRFYTQRAIKLWRNENAQTSRFCSQKTKNSYRGRWTLAFFTHSFARTISSSSSTRPLTESRNYETQLAVNSFIDARLQRQYRRIDYAGFSDTVQQNRRQHLDGGVVFRKPVRTTFLGWHQGYDLEVDHPEHNFLLASGLCCSNSHSAAYALVAYQTAWLKSHYRPEFMAAVLSADMDNTDKVVILIEECKQMKLDIHPPTINVSKYKFTVNDQGHIIYGLGALKGVGEAAIEEMLLERDQYGLFSGLYDLCKRVDLRKFNRRVLEALIRAGAFDEFDANRAGHLAELPIVLKVAEQHGKMAKTGQNDLFGLAVNADDLEDVDAYNTMVEPWSENERLNAEKLVLGLFLTGHPINQYEAELKQFTSGSIESLLANVERSKSRKMEARTAGLVVEVRTRQTKQGKIMGFATIDDRTGRLEIAVFGEVYEKYRGIFTRDSLLIAEGALGVDDYLGTLRLTVEKLYTMEQGREAFARSIQLIWNVAGRKDQDFVARLMAVLEPFKGGSCPVGIGYTSNIAKANLLLGDEWRIHPTDELLARLTALLGSDAVEIKYR